MNDTKLNNWCIYCHINKINSKRYIGITSRKPLHRWGRNGKGYEKCVLFYKAIKKYGWDNFEHIIIQENLSKEDACKLEVNLILQFNTNNSNYGYNLSSGGESGTSGILNTKRSKVVYQFSLDGDFIKEYKSAAEAVRFTNVEHSDICACCREVISEAGGYQWRYENNKNNIKAIQNQFKRRSETRKRAILQYSLDGNFIKEWKSTVDASNELRIERTGITACCNNRQDYAGNYQWKKKDDDNIPIHIASVLSRADKTILLHSMEVLQCDKETGETINSFKSLTEVGELLHMSRGEISKCCKGLRPDFNGYIWKFA